MNPIHPESLFSFDSPMLRELFRGIEHVWEVLPRIGPFLRDTLRGERIVAGTVMPGAFLGDGPVYVAEGAIIEPGACVLGPAFLGPGAVLRHGAYVRGVVIMLEGSVLGHASEAKNAVLMPDAKAPHFAYVGDSVLGSRVNLGAGTKLSNLTISSRRDPSTGRRPSIVLDIDGEPMDTGLSKFGAILGDDVQIGCNAVLNPGTILGARTWVYPNVTLRKGSYPPDSVIKLVQDQRLAPRRSD